MTHGPDDCPRCEDDHRDDNPPETDDDRYPLDGPDEEKP